MSGARCLRTVFAAAMGAFFAALQAGYFFQLQARLTAAYPSYLVITLAWLAGSATGLWLSGRWRLPRSLAFWLLGALSAYFVVLALLRSFPYQLPWLALFGPLIAISAIPAGCFFVYNRSLLGTMSRLFFWENNGFVLGWLLAFLGYVRFGSLFHWIAPAAVALAVIALERLTTDTSAEPA